MRTRKTFGLRAWRPMRALIGGLFLLGACSDLLDVNNPNNVSEDALGNPAAAEALMNGVFAATVRSLAAVMTPYAVATDELDWIGSRDAWNELETGAISNYQNEFSDQAFPFVGEARFVGDEAIRRLEGFDAAGQLTTVTARLHLARSYLYTAVVYATIADVYDDFTFSSKTIPAPPIGRAAMGTLYDKAVTYLDKAQVIANISSDAALKYDILAYRARVKHAKAVWAKITPEGAAAPAQPLVSDAGANTDATAALALGTTDQKFTLFCNLEACYNSIAITIWYEVNGRNEHATGTVYRTLIDPVSGALDPTAQASLAAFTDFENATQEGTFTLTSQRELGLILAEAALAAGDVPTFTSRLNQVRALDGKAPWAGTPAALTMLAYERQAQTWLMLRRLTDMYRFGQKEANWATNPNFSSAFNRTGLLFPIAYIERLGNPCVENAAACSP